MPADDASLEALGRYALRYVKPGQTLGLGTGHAASAFIRALGASEISVRGVPTSKASDELARSVGIPIVTLAEAGKIDIDPIDRIQDDEIRNCVEQILKRAGVTAPPFAGMVSVKLKVAARRMPQTKNVISANTPMPDNIT